MFSTTARFVTAHVEFCIPWDKHGDFAVSKAWLMSPLHCVLNWEVFCIDHRITSCTFIICTLYRSCNIWSSTVWHPVTCNLVYVHLTSNSCASPEQDCPNKLINAYRLLKCAFQVKFAKSPIIHLRAGCTIPVQQWTRSSRPPWTGSRRLCVAPLLSELDQPWTSD